MTIGPKKRPRDFNQLAASIVRASTGQPDQEKPAKPGKPKDPAAVELGRRGGMKGGPARARALTKKQRSAIGKKGAKVRWGEKS
jgi:hypothetical protein